jgi:hypothetical protein
MNYKANKLPKTITGTPRCDVPVSSGVLDNGMPQVLVHIRVYDNLERVSVAGSLRLNPEEARELARHLNTKADDANRLACTLPHPHMPFSTCDGVIKNKTDGSKR